MKRKFLSIMTTLVMVISSVGILPAVTASAGGSLGVGIGETITHEAYDVEMYCISYDSNLIECSNCEMDNDIGYAIVSWSGGEDGYFTVFGQEEGLFEITVYTTDDNYYTIYAGVADSDYTNDDYYNDVDYVELKMGYNTIDSSCTYYFTPQESGVYYFECNDCGFENRAEDYSGSYKEMHVLPANEYDRHYNLEEDGEYEFVFSNEHNGHDIYVGIVDYQQLGDLTLGTTNVYVNDDLYTQTYYCFTPEQTGQYRITSSDLSGFDPMVIITDENSNAYYCFDDIDENTYNYDEIMNLTANQNYFFSFYDWNGSTNSVINISYISSSNTTNNSNKPTQRPTNKPNTNSVIKPQTNKPNQITITKNTTVTKPAKVKSVKLTAKKKKLNVKWKKVSGATGYEVVYATNKKFTKNKETIEVKKNKVKLKGLKSNRKYFVKVRAYKKANGNTYYGNWSKVVKKKVK